MNMRKVILYSLSFTAAILTSSIARAQCPANIVLNIRNNTAANCPSTGSITIGSNAAAGSLQYTITSGPSGAPVNIPQSDSSFNALMAGAYRVKATCVSNPSDSSSINFTIANGYTAMSNIATTITSNCGSGAAGGTVKITGVTGGKLPLQYSVIQNSDPNYPDNLSVYGTTTNFTPTAYGVYQVRVKDACGQLFTKTIQLAQSLPPVKLGMNFNNDNPCNSTTWDAEYWVIDPNTQTTLPIEPYFDAGGISIKVYQATSSCGKGALLATYANLTTTSLQLPKIANNQYYFEVTTPCGNTYSYCYDYSASFEEYVYLATNTSGCGSTSPAATMNIFSTDLGFINYPLTVSVTPKSGGATTNYTFNSGTISITGLTLKNYKVVVKDACGVTVDSETISNPATSGSPSVYFVNPGDFDCLNGSLTTQEGTVHIGVGIQGFLPNLANATSVKITAGPSNVGIAGTENPAGSGVYYWQNVLPGNYSMAVVTPCGTTNLNFTVTPPWGTLVQHINAIATSFCGGSGTVQIDTANTKYNGYGSIYYTLVNAATNVGIDSNVTGVFANLSAGNYYINMAVIDYCGDHIYYIPSNTVTVNNAGTAAQVSKKLGVICEDANGNLLTTGTAYLELTGAPPITLEYKLSTSSTWITYSSNSPTSVALSGLVPNAIYDIRATSCGISSSTQVSISKLDPVRINNTTNPCPNSPYMLTIPEMPGATYSWKNPAGITVSNTYYYSIPSYNASYDGVYTCTVTFGSCVTRLVTVKLNSLMCAQPLAIKITSFVATNDNCKAVLEWSSVYHNTDREFVVERSTDGRSYTDIATIPVKLANAQYTYTDVTDDINNGNLYYRLKLVDLDGSIAYSSTEVVKSCTGNQYDENSFAINPNPAAVGQNVTITYQGAKISGYYTIMNTAGQIIFRSDRVTNSSGVSNTINVSLQNLTAGVYIVTFATDDNQIAAHQKLVVY